MEGFVTCWQTDRYRFDDDRRFRLKLCAERSIAHEVNSAAVVTAERFLGMGAIVRGSADARQLFADRHIEHSPTAENRLQLHLSRV